MILNLRKVAWYSSALLAFAHLSVAWAIQAQPVPIPEDQSINPQIDISGVGYGTIGAGRTSDHSNVEGGVNFTDSSILIGAAQKLYGAKDVGSAAFGLLTTDETTQGFGTGVSPFIYQAVVDYQSEWFEAFAGRSDNPTAHLIDFPTLRGDDLITLLNPLDPFSNGNNVEEHRYSNVASITFNQGMAYFANIHAQHLINSAGNGTSTGINSFGVTLEYMSPPGLEAFSRVPFWGAGYEHLVVSNQSPGGLHQVYAGGILNLNEGVTERWQLLAQDIVTLGSDLTRFQTITDTFQANYNTIGASLRYMHSPFGLPGAQVALTAGYSNYFKVNDARSFGMALTGVKRLGLGFDFVAQYLGQWRSSALASAQANGVTYEQVGEIGFVYSFNATINQHLSPRRTLLNQQHQYIRD